MKKPPLYDDDPAKGGAVPGITLNIAISYPFAKLEVGESTGFSRLAKLKSLEFAILPRERSFSFLQNMPFEAQTEEFTFENFLFRSD